MDSLIASKFKSFTKSKGSIRKGSSLFYISRKNIAQLQLLCYNVTKTGALRMKQQFYGFVLLSLTAAHCKVYFDDPSKMDEWGLYEAGIVAPDSPVEGGSTVLKFDDPSCYFGRGTTPGDASWNVADMVETTRNLWHVKLHTESFSNPNGTNPVAYAGLWFIPHGTNFENAKAADIKKSDKLFLGIAASGKLQIRLKILGDGESDGPPTINYTGTGAGESKIYTMSSFKRANWGGKTTFDSTDISKISAIGFVKVVVGSGPGSAFPAAGKVDLDLRITGLAFDSCARIGTPRSYALVRYSTPFASECTTPVLTPQASQAYILRDRQLQILGDKIHQITLFDLQGRIAWTSMTPSTTTIDLSALPIGSYALRIERGSDVHTEPIDLW